MITTIRAGVLINMNGVAWRTIYGDDAIIRIINTETSKMDIQTIKTEDAQNMAINKTLTIPEDQQIYIVDISSLPPEERKVFDIKKRLVTDIENTFGPTYIELTRKSEELKKLISKYMDETGWVETTIRRTITRWLHAGMQDGALTKYRIKENRQDNALVPTGYKHNFKKLPGRPSENRKAKLLDEKDYQIFEIALKKYKANRHITVPGIYADMILNNYFNLDDRPTINQLRHYIDKHMNAKSKEIKMTTAREYNNNSRLLRDTSRKIDSVPCKIVEIDAWESDLYVISDFKENQIIGKPVVYFIVDICSKAIVAYSVGFENNSKLGVSNALLNLFAPTIKDEEGEGIIHLPGIIPNIIRCDRGAEYNSAYMSKVCNELGIDLQRVPAAMGSLKGSVEHSFSELHDSFKAFLKGLGLIEKRYDSTHKKDASVTISQYKKYIDMYVSTQNLRYIKSMRLPPEMIKEGYGKSPLDIWKFKSEHGYLPRIVNESNRAQTLYSLLYEGRAFISRSGVTFQNLIYLPVFDDSDLFNSMRSARINAGKSDKDGTPLNSMIIRYDPRSINYLYYLKNGELMKLELKTAQCGGLRDITWSQYYDYLTIEKKIDAIGAERKLRIDMSRISAINEIKQEVNDKPRFVPLYENVKENRHAENQVDLFENAIENRLKDPDNTAPAIEPPSVEVTAEEAEMISNEESEKANEEFQIKSMNDLQDMISKMTNRRKD